MYARLLSVAVSFCIAFLTACSGSSHSSGPERHYALSGKVIALNAKDHTATIDAAAIPNFMEAMTMEYPIKSAAEFNSLHVGDRLTGTVNVREEGVYDLSDIKVQGAGK